MKKPSQFFTLLCLPFLLWASEGAAQFSITKRKHFKGFQIEYPSTKKTARIVVNTKESLVDNTYESKPKESYQLAKSSFLEFADSIPAKTSLTLTPPSKNSGISAHIGNFSKKQNNHLSFQRKNAGIKLHHLLNPRLDPPNDEIKDRTGAAKWGFGLALTAVVFCWLLLPLVLLVPGLILSIRGLSSSKRKLATWGIVFSGIALIPVAIIILILVAISKASGNGPI